MVERSKYFNLTRIRGVNIMALRLRAVALRSGSFDSASQKGPERRRRDDHCSTTVSSQSNGEQGAKRRVEWRREWDSNPRDLYGAYPISSRAPSTTRPSLLKHCTRNILLSCSSYE